MNAGLFGSCSHVYLLPVAMKSFRYSILKPSRNVTVRVFTSTETTCEETYGNLCNSAYLQKWHRFRHQLFKYSVISVTVPKNIIEYLELFQNTIVFPSDHCTMIPTQYFVMVKRHRITFISVFPPVIEVNHCTFQVKCSHLFL